MREYMTKIMFKQVAELLNNIFLNLDYLILLYSVKINTIMLEWNNNIHYKKI